MNFIGKNYLKLILLLIFIGIIFLIEYGAFNGSSLRSFSIKENVIRLFKKEKNTKYILLWNDCYSTDNKSFMAHENFDAVIFQTMAIPGSKPANRTASQKYVHFNVESPLSYSYDGRPDFYNLTINYRRDSDIFWPYGGFKKREVIGEGVTADQLKNKTKLVSWLVSNNSTGGTRYRWKFVTEMQKYIPVDIYGRIAKPCPGRMSKECYDLLDGQYKFFLAFENSLCSDYVTEKAFNILKYTNMVPIVLGWAEYEILTPPKSVINVDKFETIQQLAEYLRFLDKNDDEFLQYLEWKKHYEIITDRQYDGIACCSLCENLHQKGKSFSYKNVREWALTRDGKPTCYKDLDKLRINSTRN